MTPRVVSRRVVHIWRGDVFTIFRLGNSIDGEIACAAADTAKSTLWIGLRDGRISAVNLAQCPVSSHVIDLAPYFFNKAQTVLGSVGELYGILVPSSTTRCLLEAFGSEGWVKFAASQKIVHRANWPAPLDSLTYATLLHTGALCDAVAPGGQAVLAADACGRVFIKRAKCLGDALRGSGLTSAQVADLGQCVARVSVSPGGKFAVAVGELRAVAVLYVPANKDGDVSVIQSYLPGDSAALNAEQLQCDFLSDVQCRVSELECKRVLTISLDDAEVPVCHTEPVGVSGPRAEKNDDGNADNADIGESLTALLRGIEQAGTLQEAAEERGHCAEARLASFNAALLFALQSRMKTEGKEKEKAGDASIECTFSGSLVPEPGSPQFFVSSTWVGVNAFVNVHLKSKCSIAVGAGWNLRLTVDNTASCTKINAPNRSLPGDNDAVLDMNMHLEQTKPSSNTSLSGHSVQLNVALPGLPAFGETTISFPVSLTSHRPLQVSLDMQYTRAAPSPTFSQPFGTAPELSHGLSLPLVKRAVLDILTFCAQVTSRVPDSAHRRLRAARLVEALAPPSSPKRDPLPQSLRLSVPVSMAALQEALDLLKVPAPSGALFRSFLGAEFALEPAPQPTGDGGLAQLTLRAPPLVLPFLRAAVLRRVARVAVVGDIAARSAGVADAWERRLIDAVEESVCSLREAERAVADFASLAERIEKGSLEFCFAGEDLRAAKRAVGDLERATQNWRQSVREIWDPDAGELGG